MARQRADGSRDWRFAVLETLIAFAVVAIVVAVAVPAYAARAKESALRQNAHSLALQVGSNVALDLDPTFMPNGPGVDPDDSPVSLSASLAESLRSGEAGRYLNPLNGSRTIVAQTALPPAADGTPPAVWITDDQHYSYGAFTASPTTTSRLRGTLMVVFIERDGRTGCIEVFYVGAGGKRSASAVVLGV